MSVRRSITIASLIMMTSVFLSHIMGLLRDMVLAALAGTGSAMDAYVAAFLIPDIINHLLASGFMSVTFIPVFQKRISAGQTAQAWRACSNILTSGSVLLVLLIVPVLVFADSIAGLMGQSVSRPGQLEATTRLTRIVLPAQLFFYWGSVLMAVQFASKRFFIPALAPLIYNAGIIAGGILLSPRMGIEGFAWGALGGSIVGNFAVQLYGAWRTGLRFKPLIDLRDEDLRTYVMVTIPLIVGVGMQFANETFYRFFGSFVGQGGLASLNYSLKTMMTMVQVFGQAVGVAVFPFLAGLAAKQNYREMNGMVFSVIGRVAALLIPCSLLMMVLSYETIAVLFQRRHFGAASTAQTAPVLAMYCVGAFAFAANSLITRCFYALQNTILPTLVSTVAAIGSIPLYWLFLNLMGAKGIALVSSLAMICQLLLLAGLWTRRYNGSRELNGLLRKLVVIVFISAVGCVGCWGIRSGLMLVRPVVHLGPFAANLVLLCGAGIPSLLLTFIALDRLKIVVARDLVRMLARRHA